MNATFLLSVLVDMSANTKAPGGELPGDPDAAIRQLYSHYAKALHGYVEKFCPDPAIADDIVQETFIRAWRHLPQLSADDRPVRPWLYTVARNLLIDANRAARARPVSAPAPPAEIGTDSGLDKVLDRQLVSAAWRTCRPRTRACSWRPSTGAGPWRRSPASSAYRTAQPDHGCITRWMRCASTSKSATRSRADARPHARGRHRCRRRWRDGRTCRQAPGPAGI